MCLNARQRGSAGKLMRPFHPLYPLISENMLIMRTAREVARAKVKARIPKK